jgi:hypothetical protein
MLEGAIDGQTHLLFPGYSILLPHLHRSKHWEKREKTQTKEEQVSGQMGQNDGRITQFTDPP